MPNQTQSNNTPETYDAGDMADLESLTKEDMQWMIVAMAHIKKEIKELYSLTKETNSASQYYLSRIITHLDMYEHLIDSRYNYHANQEEKYIEEWEANKKAVSL